jgi:flavin-dependent dehydrogenase
MKDRVRAYTEALGLEDAAVDIARGPKIRFRRGAEPIANDRALLVGDSAGLADEFTEEGISYAIESGRLAARNILRGLGGGSILGYQADVDREVMPELRAARTIGFMFYGMLRRAPRPWMFASAKLPYLWDSFFAVQRGESTYAREVARIPVLPRIAQRMLERQQ